MAHESQMTDVKAISSFIFAGNATFTLRSRKTGCRYTYKVRDAAKKNSLYFVSLLTGPDNQHDYHYFGFVRNGKFNLSSKSSMNAESVPVMAFSWFLKSIQQGKIPETLEVWHEGRCGRCGRPLTVPESIASGFGPECSGRLSVPVVVLKSSKKRLPDPKLFTANGFRNRAENTSNYSDASIRAMVEYHKAHNPEEYYKDGEFTANGMTEEMIVDFWFKRFSSIPLENLFEPQTGLR